METSNFKQIATREVAMFTGLMFIGFVLVPVLIYFVGELVFGEYGGNGYSHFFGQLSLNIRSWDGVAWFLILSPWIGWQCLRLARLAWRATRLGEK